MLPGWLLELLGASCVRLGCLLRASWVPPESILGCSDLGQSGPICNDLEQSGVICSDRQLSEAIWGEVARSAAIWNIWSLPASWLAGFLCAIACRLAGLLPSTYLLAGYRQVSTTSVQYLGF